MITGVEGQPTVETERPPVYRFVIGRHAERAASGELRPEGIEKAKRLGQTIGSDSELYKGYASTEASDRSFTTSELAIEAAAMGERFKPELGRGTRRVAGIQYEEALSPDAQHALPTLTDLRPALKRASKMIDEATLREPALNMLGITPTSGVDIRAKQLQDPFNTVEIKTLIAELRQKNQDVGFDYILGDVPEAVHREAIGLANQLVRELELIGTYHDKRTRAARPLEKDAVLQTITHGSFAEALLMEAGFYLDEAGVRQRFSADDFKAEWFGARYIKPTEAFYFDLALENLAPDEVTVTFLEPNRPAQGKVWLDMNKLYELAGEYTRLNAYRQGEGIEG